MPISILKTPMAPSIPFQHTLSTVFTLFSQMSLFKGCPLPTNVMGPWDRKSHQVRVGRHSFPQENVRPRPSWEVGVQRNVTHPVRLKTRMLFRWTSRQNFPKNPKRWGFEGGNSTCFVLVSQKGHNEVRRFWPTSILGVSWGPNAISDSLWANFYIPIHSKIHCSLHKGIRFLKGEKAWMVRGEKRKSKSQKKLQVTQILINRSYTFWKFSSECPSSLAVFVVLKLRSFAWY